MELRRHQIEMDEAVSGILVGSGVREITAHVTPGGGKSTLPIQAGRIVTEGLADRICWLAPRSSLQDQAERNFTDPYFRRMFNHNLLIRSSTNQSNPSRGLNGWVSTYQAIAVDTLKSARRDFDRHRYVLALDEFHHLAHDGEWTESIRELVVRAAFVLKMTGTLSRGDQKRIAFIDYAEDPFSGGTIPSFGADDHLIRYTRKDALQERAIIPLEFHFADGVASWKKESGREVTAKISTGRSDANQALYTALKTEYAQELLYEGIEHWMQRQYSRDHSSLLVVAASIESAKEYTGILKRQGQHAEIATSDDTPAALRQIKALKAGKLKILVTVGMAYEGLDCPSISHIICLTNIRSMPWIEQMVARAVRIDPLAGPYETQKGHIFAPADQMFVELARLIEADQCEAVAKTKAPGEPRGQGEGNGNGRPGITPLSSKLLHGQADLFGYQKPYLVPPTGMDYVHQRTQRERETELRETINRRVLDYCRVYNVKPATMNRILKDQFGKYRDYMTLPELEKLQGYLDMNYRVPGRSEPMTVLQPAGRVL